MTSLDTSSVGDDTDDKQYAVATSKYSDKELADIYSRARTDYIVPMPMNAMRMREYIDHYNVDLDHSYVAMDPSDHELNGVIMLGIRDKRGWITRMGVLPERRRRHVGQFLMDQAMNVAQEKNLALVQLEVIKGNEPAHRLFKKYGFEETRELLVIRRAPSKLSADLLPKSNITVTPLSKEIPDRLGHREKGSSWVEETASLLNMDNLGGYDISLPDGENGWIIFQKTAFQLQHIVMNPDASPAMMRALLSQVHYDNPRQDTKVENLPLNHPTWPVFEEFGYVISFQRIEMFLHL